MKKVEFSLFLVLLLVGIICCDGKDFPVSNIGLKNFSNTGCKPSTRSSESKQPWGQVFGSSSRHTQVPVPVTILTPYLEKYKLKIDRDWSSDPRMRFLCSLYVTPESEKSPIEIANEMFESGDFAGSRPSFAYPASGAD